MIKEFMPDIIIVSCGFDSAMHDFLGWSRLSPIFYGYMTN
jgi:acetoin utilization deacetylase AcuC-like enzyme